MPKYPTQIATLTEKELAELNFTALLHLHSKIDRIEDCLEHLSKQADYNYLATNDKPALHLGDYFKKISSLVDTLKMNISTDLEDQKKNN